MKILHLNLKKKYFNLILLGEKTTEYREIKEYWVKRLQNKEYDVIRFQNGYSKDAPFFFAEYLGYEIENRTFEITGKTIPVFAIKLGKISTNIIV